MMKKIILLFFIVTILDGKMYAASNPNILPYPPAVACGFSGDWPQSLVNTHDSRVSFIPIVPDVTPSIDLVLDLDVNAAVIRIPYILLTTEENDGFMGFFTENNSLSDSSFSEPTSVRRSDRSIIYRLNDNTHNRIRDSDQNNRFSLYSDETNGLLEILLIRNREDVINESEQAIEILINNYLSRQDGHVANCLNNLGFLNSRHSKKATSEEIVKTPVKNNSSGYNDHETNNESEDSEFIEILIDTFGDENGEEGILRMLEEQGFLNDETRMVVKNSFKNGKNNEKNNENNNIPTEEATEITEVTVKDNNQKDSLLYDAFAGVSYLIKGIFTLVVTIIRFIYYFIFNRE